MARITMVEDDAAIAELVRYNLETDGHSVVVHRDGESLLRALAGPAESCPELILLDVMLPGLDGFAVLDAVRRRSPCGAVPVLMLTARGSEADKVRGLESGADDYLSKPFGIRELQARVRALLRRAGLPQATPSGAAAPVAAREPGGAGAKESGAIRGAGGLSLDDARHRVFRHGAEIQLTHREYELLRHLMRSPGIAFSRDDLLREVWGFDFAGETRTVDVHVRQLRLKLGDDDASAPLIETVRGRGYRFRETPSREKEGEPHAE